jgi:uncharacterized protein DUF2844
MSDERVGFIKARLVVAWLVIVLLIFAPGLPAWASLGGDTASIEADQVLLQGSRTMKAAEFYAVHEIQAASGTTVREYLSPDGKVFAVAWNGPRVPDLRQLLGNYFEQYRTAVQSRSGPRMARRPVMIEQPGLVVEIGGHIRSFAGRAYVPEMLPAGVRAEDIQ